MARKRSIQSRKTPAAKRACIRRKQECPDARDIRLEKQRITQDAIRSQETPVQSAQRRLHQRERQVCCQKAGIRYKGSLRTYFACGKPFGLKRRLCSQLRDDYISEKDRCVAKRQELAIRVHCVPTLHAGSRSVSRDACAVSSETITSARKTGVLPKGRN